MKKIYPHIKIFGVETHDSNAMTVSIEQGYPVTLEKVGLFADGAAVRRGTLSLSLSISKLILDKSATTRSESATN